MKSGITVFPTRETPDPATLAREAEERGFDSLWFPEHSHIPSSRITPWGGRKGAPPLPSHYWKTYDAFIALTAAASATSTLRLATGITLVAQRDPIWTAKQVASLDVLSGGRVIFGVGYGWNREEMGQHGVAYTERRALLREKVLMMKQLWTEDEAAYQGELIELEPSWALPKPAQQPHPPIILGSSGGPKTFRDIVEFCDGWYPIPSRTSLGDRVAELRQAADDAGRDPKTIELGVFAAPYRDDFVDEMRELGFGTILYQLRQNEPGDVMESLEEATALAARHRD